MIATSEGLVYPLNPCISEGATNIVFRRKKKSRCGTLS